MHENHLLRTLRLRNFLSFGEAGEEVTLQPLNVLIGPNASGKSNLIEAIALLKATPKDLPSFFREGGGIGEWLWKGGKADPEAEIEATINYPAGFVPLRYRINFTRVGARPELVDEVVENERSTGRVKGDVFFFYRYRRGNPIINVWTAPGKSTGTARGRTERALKREDLDPEQSVLAQRKDPDQYPEITYLGSRFAAIKLYREWNLGRYTAARMPQKADLLEDFLEENAGNLGLVLNDLEHQSGAWQKILENMRTFHDRLEDITTRIHGGTVQIFLHEKGLNQPVPATRLSDGTLRYLCLLTILLHPSPPPLICIEEPELGLHPDILPKIADLLVDASLRTQLIVTTHSDVLISALTETPESVLVCEKDDDGSHYRRLDKEWLKEWTEKYSLGELWRMGEIGGTP